MAEQITKDGSVGQARGMAGLTARQLEELTRLRDLKLPKSFERNGWPGFPERLLDMRVIPSLQKLGYIEGGIYLFGEGREARGGVWWRITDAGRAALAPPSHARTEV